MTVTTAKHFAAQFIAFATLAVLAPSATAQAHSPEVVNEVTEMLEGSIKGMALTVPLLAICPSMQQDAKDVEKRFQRVLTVVGTAYGKKQLIATYRSAVRQNISEGLAPPPPANCIELHHQAYAAIDVWEGAMKGTPLFQKAWAAAGGR